MRARDKQPEHTWGHEERTKAKLQHLMLRRLDASGYQECIDEEAKQEGWALKFAPLDCYGSMQMNSTWRCPRTQILLLWRDGDISPVFETVPGSKMPKSDIDRLNRERKGQCMVISTEKPSHMWDSRTAQSNIYTIH